MKKNHLQNNSLSEEEELELFSEPVDYRDSFSHVYVSLIPFLIVEYITELLFASVPAGLVFPMGFILFWGFYYTYYQPQALKSHLEWENLFNLSKLPNWLIGFVIWFVKVTIIELMHLLFIDKLQKVWIYFSTKQPKQSKRQQNYRRPGTDYSRVHGDPPRQKQPSFPPEIANALETLGMQECRNWHAIQKRYRFLAKAYHPDLNPEVTEVGRRFMMYDHAYRKLQKVRTRYFT